MCTNTCIVKRFFFNFFFFQIHVYTNLWPWPLTYFWKLINYSLIYCCYIVNYIFYVGIIHVKEFSLGLWKLETPWCHTDKCGVLHCNLMETLQKNWFRKQQSFALQFNGFRKQNIGVQNSKLRVPKNSVFHKHILFLFQYTWSCRLWILAHEIFVDSCFVSDWSKGSSITLFRGEIQRRRRKGNPFNNSLPPG